MSEASSSAPSSSASPPSAPAAESVAMAEADGGGGFGGLHPWAAGGSLFAACGDLLCAVLLGLTDPVGGAATRFDLRDLGLCAGGAALFSFLLAAIAWSGGARGLAVAAAGNLAIAAAAWFGAAPVFHGLPFAVALAAGVHLLAAVLAGMGAAGARGVAADRLAGRHACAARTGAENIESVLVAIAFALAIRHFAVEAYKIPTGSMEPTLLGDKPGRGPGDRVLVAKWPAMLGGPDRWETWVFRPPLERTINYVKRVGGLPGEQIRIEHGDLYADGTICRKPPHAREALWFPVWPVVSRVVDKVPPWSGPGFRKDGEDGFVAESAPGPRLLTFERAVRDGPGGLGGANEVGDLRVRFRVEDPEPGTEFTVRITGRGGACEFKVAADGSSASATIAGAAAVAQPPGAPVSSIECWFSDLEFGARVNGTLLFAAEVPASDGAVGRQFGAAFGVAKGGASFREVHLDRDVYYTGTHVFTVPAGHWFFLGDNSSSSEDSRKWITCEVREIGGAGRVFHTMKNTRPIKDNDGRMAFRDRDGVWRSFAESEIAVSGGPVPMSFVPAADLHGRAFAIFWPPRWFTQVPGGRLGLLP